MKLKASSESKLVAKWEARLKREGMPAEFPRSKRQSSIEPYDYSHELADSPRFQYWTSITHVVNALPTSYPNRAFLVAYAESGCYHKTCRRFRYTVSKGRHILGKFAEYMKELNEESA